MDVSRFLEWCSRNWSGFFFAIMCISSCHGWAAAGSCALTEKMETSPFEISWYSETSFFFRQKHRIQGYRTWCNEELQIGNVSNFVATLLWKWNRLGIWKGVRLAVKCRAMYIEEPKFVPIKLRFHDRNKFICKTLWVFNFFIILYMFCLQLQII